MKIGVVIELMVFLLYLMQHIAYASGSGSAIIYYEKAQVSYINKELDEALSLYDQAINEDPTFHDAYYGKAQALYDKGEYEEADKCIDTLTDNPSLSENSDLPKFYDLGGKIEDRILDNGGIPLVNDAMRGLKAIPPEYLNVIDNYDKAIRINPNYTSAWNNKGIILGKLQRFEESLICFEKAIEINSSLAEAWSNRGVSLDKMGRYQEAIESYEKSIGIDPSMPEAWYNKANTLFELSELDEARKCFLIAGEYDVNLKSKGEFPNWIYKYS